MYQQETRAKGEGETMPLIQRKLTPDEAKTLIKKLQESDIKAGGKPRAYQYLSDNVGDWRMLPNGSTCFYCPPYYGYAQQYP